MGLLINGTWSDAWYDTKSTGGRFVRKQSQFRDRVSADGSTAHPAEVGRYHLYVSLACPWAHRTLIFRALKKLDSIISISIVDPIMGDQGWSFSTGPGCIPDPLLSAEYLHQVYTAADPDYTGRVTVPVLWDKEKRTIVNNESSEIIRMMNAEFGALSADPFDYYPENLNRQIDDINAVVYDCVNNGVYRCGFATTQEAYEEAFSDLFGCLDMLDDRLGAGRYLVEGQLTEADWRLFTTLLRFDPVYVGHFKCNLRRIADYPNLSNYLRDLFQVPGVADTVNSPHIKQHYYRSHRTINPTGIVPVGPSQDLDAPHDRDRFGEGNR